MSDPKRLRVSAWFNPTDLMVLTAQSDPKSPPVFTRDGAGREVPQLLLDAIARGKGALDDASVQRTINNDMKMNVVWDPLVLPGKGDDTREGFFQGAIKACHKLGIQCLVGYTMMRPKDGLPSKFSVFNDWLAGRALPDLKPADHATRIVAFLDKHLPECDGVHFDIEGLTSGLPQPEVDPRSGNLTRAGEIMKQKKDEAVARLTARYGEFLGALSDALSKKKRLVALATAGLTAAREVIPGRVAGDGERIHQYTLAKGHPNFLVRPMAYDYQELKSFDAATLQQDREATLAWHDKIIAYATSVLPPQQFQLGIKTISSKDNNQPKKYGGFITDPDVLRRRCQDPLRKKGIGVALFPTSSSFWKPANDGLNGP